MAAKNVDTCTSKGMPLLNYYCEAVLSRLGFGSTKESSKGGISSSSTVTGGDKTALPEADDRRLLPIKLREVLIIARFSSGVNAAPKKEGTNPLSEELDNNCEKRTIIRRELDAILDATRDEWMQNTESLVSVLTTPVHSAPSPTTSRGLRNIC